MCYSVRQSKRLFNTVVNFHPKNSYDHPFKVFILGRIHRTQPMYVFNLIQDRMIDNCAAVFQTHGIGTRRTIASKTQMPIITFFFMQPSPSFQICHLP